MTKWNPPFIMFIKFTQVGWLLWNIHFTYLSGYIYNVKLQSCPLFMNVTYQITLVTRFVLTLAVWHVPHVEQDLLYTLFGTPEITPSFLCGLGCFVYSFLCCVCLMGILAMPLSVNFWLMSLNALLVSFTSVLQNTYIQKLKKTTLQRYIFSLNNDNFCLFLFQPWCCQFIFEFMSLNYPLVYFNPSFLRTGIHQIAITSHLKKSWYL